MAFNKVNKGQKFQPTATVWNGFVDAANWVAQQQQNTTANTERLKNQNGIVFVKNSSGTDADVLSVVALSDFMIKPTNDEAKRTFIADVPFFSFTKVTKDNLNKTPIAVLQQPIKANQSGKALVMGITPCYVNIENESHTSAIADSSTTFGAKSSTDGDVKILWKPSGTGKQLCMVGVGLGGSTAYKSIFKLQAKDGKIEISDGSDENNSKAGFVFVNGIFKEMPKSSVTASGGYLVIEATLGSESVTVDYKIVSSIEATKEKGYYVLGKVKTATGGGGYQVFQYYHSTPHIIVCGECEEQETT